MTHRKEKAFTFSGFPYKRRAGMSAFPSVFLQLFVVNVCLDSQNLQPAIKRRQCKHQIFAFFFIWHCDFVSHISFCVLTRFSLKKVFKSCCKYCRVLHGSFFCHLILFVFLFVEDIRQLCDQTLNVNTYSLFACEPTFPCM